MLKKYIEWTRGETGKQLREHFQDITKKKKTIADRLMDRLMSMGKVTKKNTQFESYYVIEQIEGTMSCDMTH